MFYAVLSVVLEHRDNCDYIEVIHYSRPLHLCGKSGRSVYILRATVAIASAMDLTIYVQVQL